VGTQDSAAAIMFARFAAMALAGIDAFRCSDLSDRSLKEEVGSRRRIVRR
jgi:hypothetical protein